MTPRQRIFLLLTGLLGVACAQSVSRPLAEAGKTQETILRRGDVLSIKVFGEQDLSTDYRIESDGCVLFPMLGRVEALGRRPSELTQDLTVKLQKFVRDPLVSVTVSASTAKRVSVIGQVKSPGTFPFEEGMSIVQAITLAGGFGPMAAENSTLVTRVVAGKETRTRVAVKDIGRGEEPNFELNPGDIVYVPETIF